MRRVFAAIIFACLLSFAAGGCSLLNLKGETEAVMDPSKLHEDCVKLEPGDSISYSFKASGPVDFNIHYHEVGKIFYPVLKKDTAAEQGRFSADKEEFYCLMWTNIQRNPVHVSYTYKVIQAGKVL
jgi:hypothetical protein